MVGISGPHALDHDDSLCGPIAFLRHEAIAGSEARFEFALRDHSVVLAIKVFLRPVLGRAHGHDYDAMRNLGGLVMGCEGCSKVTDCAFDLFDRRAGNKMDSAVPCDFIGKSAELGLS